MCTCRTSRRSEFACDISSYSDRRWSLAPFDRQSRYALFSRASGLPDEPDVSVGFLFDCSLSRGDGFEAFVRNRLAALDRKAVSSGGKTHFGTLNCGELLA